MKPSSAPVLILQGTKDELVPAAQSVRLHTKLDEVHVANQLILIEGAPHDGPAYSTAEREKQVLDFLEPLLK